ncbi:MAG: hypothetical protein KJ645_07380 [Planctomycetes bacterium]|nr:hypothetical protein [Planctomycetota bacterium]
MIQGMERLAMLVILCALMLTADVFAGCPAEEEDEIVVVQAGLILPVEGESIQKGVVGIRNGKIEALGTNVDYPRGAKVIHAEDLVVMPGLINPCTSQGLRPFMRTGLHTDLKVADEFVLEEKPYDDLLRRGFTAFGMVPTGSGFPGQTLAFKPLGKDRADWTLNDSAYIYSTMNQPSMEKTAFKNAFEAADKEIEKVEAARKAWEEKQKQKAEAKTNQEQTGEKNTDKPEESAEKKPPREESPAETKKGRNPDSPPQG